MITVKSFNSKGEKYDLDNLGSSSWYSSIPVWWHDVAKGRCEKTCYKKRNVTQIYQIDRYHFDFWQYMPSVYAILLDEGKSNYRSRNG